MGATLRIGPSVMRFALRFNHPLQRGPAPSRPRVGFERWVPRPTAPRAVNKTMTNFPFNNPVENPPRHIAISD